VKRVRADLLLVERGLCESRTRAQALILAGVVKSGEARVEKAGQLLAPDAPLDLVRGPRFVSRGGDKLDAALDAFGVEVTGRVCVDVGASTGGFTDCLLQRGAARVHAVDVGRGQLHEKLRGDARVIMHEGVNARYLTLDVLGEAVELAVVDASFIGLGKLAGALAAVVIPRGELVALVKPQFEAGRREAARGRGVIRDPEVRAAAVAQAVDALGEVGFETVREIDSALAGPKGNLERFVHARKRS
jgi:23S rRNA (cytidine1920-2'-O)/16S rRNA (cytidine1409-2'-O)-methyltransferase